MANNLEISQFSSHVSVNDATRHINIKRSNSENIGIASDIPRSKVDVRGDVIVSGVVTASSYFGDGSTLTGIISLSTTQQINVSGAATVSSLTVNTNSILNGITTIANLSIPNILLDNINVSGTSTLSTVKISSGIITAVSGIVTYYGDGRYLQNITSGVGISSSIGGVSYGATIINFIGDFISHTVVSAGIATIVLNNQRLDINDSGIVVSGIITATTFVGALTGNSATVTTNANLTGDVTSTGNATAIAAGVIVDADINASAAIVDTKLATIATALKVSNSATTATNLNTASTIVSRDSSGNFIAGIITATSFVGSGANLTGLPAGGSTLNAASGSQRVVVTSLTSGILTSSGTDADLVFDATTNTLSSTNFSGNLSDSAIKNYTEVISVIGNTSTTATLNLANGNVFTATLTGNCTFTFTTGVATGAASFTLVLLNDATSGRSIVWPASVKWPNNIIPVRTTAGNATDIWSFFTPNNGTTWYGNIALYNLT